MAAVPPPIDTTTAPVVDATPTPQWIKDWPEKRAGPADTVVVIRDGDRYRYLLGGKFVSAEHITAILETQIAEIKAAKAARESAAAAATATAGESIAVKK